MEPVSSVAPAAARGKEPFPRRDPSFVRALALTLFIYLSSLVLAPVPIIGWLLALTLVPYLASALGTRLARPSDRIPVSLSASIVWSSLETVAIVGIASAIRTPMGFTMGALEWSIIAAIWLLNVAFGTLGALRPWMDPFRQDGPH